MINLINLPLKQKNPLRISRKFWFDQDISLFNVHNNLFPQKALLILHRILEISTDTSTKDSEKFHIIKVFYNKTFRLSLFHDLKYFLSLDEYHSSCRNSVKASEMKKCCRKKIFDLHRIIIIIKTQISLHEEWRSTEWVLQG